VKSDGDLRCKRHVMTDINDPDKTYILTDTAITLADSVNVKP